MQLRGLGKSKVCRVGQQLETQERFAFESKDSSLAAFLAEGGCQSVLSPSTDWMRPTHVEGHLILQFKC